MEITIATTLLASPDLALGRVGPAGLAVNGQQILDDADFFRAAAPTFFVRGTEGVTLQFSVTRLFSSVRAAEAFILLHFNSTPLEGLLTCTCGDAGDTQTVYLRDAKVQTVQLPGYRGTSVGVQYTIRGAEFTSDVPPEEIPGEPDDGEGEFIVLRRGKIAIDAAAESVDVVFSSPLSSVPVVTATVSRPAGSPKVGCTLDEDSVTITGFSVELDAPTPDGTFKLHYIAIE